MSLSGESKRTKVERTYAIAIKSVGVETKNIRVKKKIAKQQKPLSIREHFLIVKGAVKRLNNGCASGYLVPIELDLLVGVASGKRSETGHTQRLVRYMLQQPEQQLLHALLH